MFCYKCGQKLGEGDKFCGSCGTPILTKNEINIKQQNSAINVLSTIPKEINTKDINNETVIAQKDSDAQEGKNDNQEGMVFIKCSKCGEKDNFVKCVECNRIDNLLITPDGIKCKCGDIIESVECPSCNAIIIKDGFYKNKDKENETLYNMQTNQNQKTQEQQENIVNIFRLLGAILIIAIGIWFFNYLFCETGFISLKPEIEIMGNGAKNVDFYDFKMRFNTLTGKMRYKGGYVGEIKYTIYGSNNTKLLKRSLSYMALNEGESCAIELATFAVTEKIIKVVINVSGY